MSLKYIFLNLLRAGFKAHEASTKIFPMGNAVKDKVHVKTSTKHFPTLVSAVLTYLDKDELLDLCLSQHVINYESVIQNKKLYYLAGIMNTTWRQLFL